MDAFSRALAGAGDSSAKISTAVVTGLSVNRDTVVVNYYGNTFTARKLRSYVPSVGDVVMVVGDPQRLVVLDSLGPHDAAATPGGSGTPSVPPPTQSDQNPVSGSTPFVALSSMSWRPQGGWMTWDGDLYQGAGYGYGPHTGLWFYGTAPSSTLAGKTITRCRVYVPRRNGGGVNGPTPLHVVAHGYGSRPGGQPSVSGTVCDITLARGAGDWAEVPASVGQEVVDGVYLGFGINGDPYAVVDGVSRISQSGTAIFNWTEKSV